MEIFGLALYVAVIVAVCIRIILYTENPSVALAYMLLVVSFPIFGIILYFSVGLNYRKQQLYDKKLVIDELEFPKLEQEVTAHSKKALLNNKEKIAHFYQLAKFSKNKNITSDNNTATLLLNGEEKFPDVIESLKNAKHHIHIEYYIYEDDEIGNQIADILIEKAQQGVEVRFIYDDLGSRSIRKRLVKRLREAGVEAYPFHRIYLIAIANRMNYRNHRKIIVVDGKVGYVGGINVSDKYINHRGDKLYWRDTHLKIEGVSVINLQFIFLADWNFCADQKIGFANEYFPVVNEDKHYGDHLVQIVSSGPDSKYASIKYTIMQAILKAESEVCITTPYFIPDKSFLDAIYIAALSGVKVKILMPGVSDSFIINTTTQSYFEDLLKAGVEIHTYNKGFVHAKTMVCDKKVSMVGTANLDNRSFDLNFEINAIVFDEKMAEQLREIFYEDLESSTQITLKEWLERPLYMKLLEKVLYLFSSLM